jgi:hypothetical protein
VRQLICYHYCANSTLKYAFLFILVICCSCVHFPFRMKRASHDLNLLAAAVERAH